MNVLLLNFCLLLSVCECVCVFQQRPRKRSSFRASLRRNAHICCAVLTLLIYACLPAITWCRPLRAHVVHALAWLYLVYLADCWRCDTRRALRHKADVSTVYDHVARMRQALPTVRWKAVCSRCISHIDRTNFD